MKHSRGQTLTTNKHRRTPRPNTQPASNHRTYDYFHVNIPKKAIEHTNTLTKITKNLELNAVSVCECMCVAHETVHQKFVHDKMINDRCFVPPSTHTAWSVIFLFDKRNCVHSYIKIKLIKMVYTAINTSHMAYIHWHGLSVVTRAMIWAKYGAPNMHYMRCCDIRLEHSALQQKI